MSPSWRARPTRAGGRTDGETEDAPCLRSSRPGRSMPSADEGYRDGYSDGIRRLRRRKPGWPLGLAVGLTFLSAADDRRAKWEAYGRGYDDGWEQAGANQRVIIVDKGKEGTGAV